MARKQWQDKPTELPIMINIKAVFPVPKSYLNSKGKLTPKHKQEINTYGFIKKPDADNIAKAIMDALTGIVWLDDKQVVKLTVTKEYMVESKELSKEFSHGYSIVDVQAIRN